MEGGGRHSVYSCVHALKWFHDSNPGLRWKPLSKCSSVILHVMRKSLLLQWQAQFQIFMIKNIQDSQLLKKYCDSTLFPTKSPCQKISIQIYSVDCTRYDKYIGTYTITKKTKRSERSNYDLWICEFSICTILNSANHLYQKSEFYAKLVFANSSTSFLYSILQILKKP